MRTAWALAFLLGLATACGGEDPADPAPGHENGALGGGSLHVAGTADWPSAEARRLAPDRHPTPYTADQIRRGCPHGRTSTFRMTSGATVLVQEWRFTDPDAQGVTWTTTPLDAQGKPTADARARRQLWRDLQAHASYPSAATTVTEESVQVPAGTFKAMRYTVTETKDGHATVSSYWFAWELPGPPVKMEQRRDGALLGSMEMIEHRIRG